MNSVLEHTYDVVGVWSDVIGGLIISSNDPYCDCLSISSEHSGTLSTSKLFILVFKPVKSAFDIGVAVSMAVAPFRLAFVQLVRCDQNVHTALEYIDSTSYFRFYINPAFE